MVVTVATRGRDDVFGNIYQQSRQIAYRLLIGLNSCKLAPLRRGEGLRDQTGHLSVAGPQVGFVQNDVKFGQLIPKWTDS